MPRPADYCIKGGNLVFYVANTYVVYSFAVSSPSSPVARTPLIAVEEVGLDDLFDGELKTDSVKKAEDEDEDYDNQCPICYLPFDGELIGFGCYFTCATTSNHPVCNDCVGKIMLTSNCCPTCRAPHPEQPQLNRLNQCAQFAIFLLMAWKEVMNLLFSVLTRFAICALIL